MYSYDKKNWYWIVDGDESHVYSSASSTDIAITDAAYGAWVSAGNRPTKISADDMLLLQIGILEESITERMKQEALAGSTDTFQSGTYSGRTAAEAIAIIVAEKKALRARLS